MGSLKKNRPFTIHILIILFFVIIGIILFVAESFSEYDGGWLFKKYILTKLYLLILAGYFLLSTIVVSLVGLIYKRKKRNFSKSAVVLCHVIIIGSAWAFFSLGLHDFFQYKSKSNQYIPQKVKVEEGERKMPPVSPELAKGKLEVKNSGQAIEKEEQKGD